MHPALAEALADDGGALARSAHPELKTRIDAALRRGEMRRLLPGVYVAGQPSLELRARAACLADPGAVVFGPAAAHLIGWTHRPLPDLVSVATGRLRPQPGFGGCTALSPPG